jgi:hypothetical protein
MKIYVPLLHINITLVSEKGTRKCVHGRIGQKLGSITGFGEHLVS